MAILYPSRLPDRVLNNKILKGEVAVYNALAKLSDDFEVFHNRCPNNGRSVEAYERKIDFIVIHEQFGFLAIEVKGGRIRVGSDGSFQQYTWKGRFWKSIDPFAQVKIALISLIKMIKEDGGNYWIPNNCCVIFPSTNRAELLATVNKLPAGVLCEDDLRIIPTTLKDFFSGTPHKPAWKRDHFIDMRRRLQNMPEANEFYKTASKQDINKGDKKQIIRKSKRSEQIVLHRNRGLKWYELLFAGIVFVVTFLIICWLLPNSFFQR